MDEMQMIDGDKIESSAPYAIAWASSVPGDAQVILLIDETICTVVEVQPNG